MAFETVGVQVAVEGLQAFQRGADTFNKGITGMIGSAISAGAGLVLNPLKAFGGALLNIFEIAAGFITRDVFNFIMRGIQEIAGIALRGAADFQQLEIQMGAFLSAMGQSPAEQQAFIDWLSTLAKDSNLTNIAIADLARGFLSLGEFGVEQVKRLTTATTLWSAQMGLSESQAERVIYNILQTGRSSKITERDIREFGNAGVNLTLVFKTMAQQLGITEQEAVEAAKNGKEGWLAFIEAFQVAAEQNFPDAMERMRGSWNQTMSNIQDVIQSVFGREVLGPALANLAEFISGILDRVFNMREAFRAFGQQLGETVQGILDAVGPIVDMIFSGNSLEVKLRFITLVFQDWLKQLVPPVLAGLRTLVETAWNWIAEQRAGWLAALETWAVVLVEWVTRQIPKTIVALYTWLNKLLDWVPGARSPLLDALLEMGQVFIDWVGPIIPPLIEKFRTVVLPKITGWIKENGPVIFETLHEWATAFIDWIEPMVLPFLDELKEKFLPPVLAWIGDQVDELKQKFTDEWLPAFTDWINDEVAPVLLTELGALMGTLAGWFVGEGAEDFGRLFANWFVPTETGGKSLAKTFVSSFLHGLWDGLIAGFTVNKNTWSNQLGYDLTQIVRNAINQAKAALGIASPSRVTMQLIGEPLGLGIAAGIQKSVGSIAGAFQAATMGAMAAPAPAMAAASSTTYAPQFNLSVHSPAPANVQQSFDTLRALYGSET